MLATRIIVVDEASVTRSIEVRRDRVGRFIRKKAAIVRRPAALTGGEARPDLLQSLRRNGFGDIFPITARRNALHHPQVEVAKSRCGVIWNHVANTSATKAPLP